MASAAWTPPLDAANPQRARSNIRHMSKINVELSADRQQVANLFFGFIVKAKQPSPCELGCLLIVVLAVD